MDKSKKVRAKKCKGYRSDGGVCTKMTTIRGGYCSYHLDQKTTRKSKDKLENQKKERPESKTNKEIKIEIPRKDLKNVEIENVYIKKVKDDMKMSKFMEKMKPYYQEIGIEYDEYSRIEYKNFGLRINPNWVKEGYVDISDIMIIVGNMMIEGLCYLILTSIDMKTTFGYRREITDGLLKREFIILDKLKSCLDDNHFLPFITKFMLDDHGGIKCIMDKINEEIGKKYFLTNDAQKTLIKYMLYYYNKTIYIDSPKDLFMKLSDILPLDSEQIKQMKQYMYRLMI